MTCMMGDVSLLPRTAIQTPCERALSVKRSPHADRSRRRESHLALDNTDMQKGMDGLAMLVQEVLTDGNCASADDQQPSRLTSVKS
jgi:hypothetical protein